MRAPAAISEVVPPQRVRSARIGRDVGLTSKLTPWWVWRPSTIAGGDREVAQARVGRRPDDHLADRRRRRPRRTGTTLPGDDGCAISGSSSDRSIDSVTSYSVPSSATSSVKSSSRLSPARKRRTSSSAGNTVVVAPSSAPMLAMTWRSIADSVASPGPVVLDDAVDAALGAVAAQHLEDDVLAPSTTAAARRSARRPRSRASGWSAARRPWPARPRARRRRWRACPASRRPGCASPSRPSSCPARRSAACASGARRRCRAWSTTARSAGTAERRKTWSSAFFSSVCSRLWSTYCTDTSVRDPVETQRLQLLHHQGAGGVLGQGLIDPQRDLLAGRHLPVDEVGRDELVGDSVRHAELPRGRASCGGSSGTPFGARCCTRMRRGSRRAQPGLAAAFVT